MLNSECRKLSCLDVLCYDAYGKTYDLEIQRPDSGARSH